MKVAEIHFCNAIIEADELLNSMQPLHLEMLILNATIRLAQIHAASHLAGALLSTREKVDQKLSEVLGGTGGILCDQRAF